MPLRDLIRKKDQIESDQTVVSPNRLPQATEFTFVRTDTHTEEYVQPPAFGNDNDPLPSKSEDSPRKSFARFGRSSRASAQEPSPSPTGKEHKRLSQRLNLRKDRSASTSSTHLPQDLPHIEDDYRTDDREDAEAKWEDRALRLANKSPNSTTFPPTEAMSQLGLGSTSQSPSRPRSVSDAASDVNIQEAIRLHESGQLEKATDMFRQLAGQGNVLSQVLYGLSLRHGWGCKPDPQQAVTYLSQAASNSAEIEAQALQAGMKKGGAAKGELVLAIFELANCFRNGWGVPVDKVAARHYYETAANLGDTDAMNEAAWCYMEGFGGKKDKVSRYSFSSTCLAPPFHHVIASTSSRASSGAPKSGQAECHFARTRDGASRAEPISRLTLDSSVTPPRYHARQHRYHDICFAASRWASMHIHNLANHQSDARCTVSPYLALALAESAAYEVPSLSTVPILRVGRDPSANQHRLFDQSI